MLGLENEITGNSSLTNQLIELVLELRKDAKANKNYQISDKIRDELKTAVNKENYLTQEDAKLINDFLNKIKKELDNSK